MTGKLQYRPRMRQSERVTSPLAVPLALSSAILVVLLALATTPQAVRFHRAQGAPSVTTIPPEHSTDSRSTQTVSHTPTRTVLINRPSSSPGSTATSISIPRLSHAHVRKVIGEGVVSGGSASVSYVDIAGPHTVQFSTDAPVAISLWDGVCTVDPVNQIITNTSSVICTVQLQSDTFMPWQLLELA